MIPRRSGYAASAPARSRLITPALALVSLCVLGASCGGGGSSERSEGTGTQATTPSKSATPPPQGVDGVVKIDGDRGLYVRCRGSGSPTVVMEGGDGDTSDSYAFAEPAVADVTRTCV